MLPLLSTLQQREANRRRPRKMLTIIRLSELLEKYPAATKANFTSSDQNNTKIPKLVKLSSVLSSPATTEAESECAVSRRILAAVHI
ncbi:hypothetical protein GJ496_001074 [Pomphorhynchus laevis]|nr:hypothetical protein GJ496_001074 [Pomphorhynchus laevis]